MTCRHFFTLPWDPRATDGSKWPEGGGLIVKLAKNEYIIAGNGIVVVFQSKTEKAQAEEKKLGEDGFVDNGGTETKKQATTFKGKRIGIGYVDQVEVDKTANYSLSVVIMAIRTTRDAMPASHVETIKYSTSSYTNTKYIYI